MAFYYCNWLQASVGHYATLVTLISFSFPAVAGSTEQRVMKLPKPLSVPYSIHYLPRSQHILHGVLTLSAQLMTDKWPARKLPTQKAVRQLDLVRCFSSLLVSHWGCLFDSPRYKRRYNTATTINVTTRITTARFYRKVIAAIAAASTRCSSVYWE